MLDFPPSLSDPDPDMPGTLWVLYLLALLPLVGKAGREAVWVSCSPLSLSCRLSAGSEW